jgi:hypothetical protein
MTNPTTNKPIPPTTIKFFISCGLAPEGAGAGGGVISTNGAGGGGGGRDAGGGVDGCDPDGGAILIC